MSDLRKKRIHNSATMKDRVSLVGEVYGRLTVVRQADTSDGRRRWICACSCGGEAIVSTSGLRQKQTQSCGCILRERLTTHGHTGSDTYKTWGWMLSRCRNPKDTAWPRYGGRGIRVCERWQTFENFLSDMGERPSGTHSIERVDNDGNYEPGNCRWATEVEQARNKRDTAWVEFNGERRSIAEWADRMGVGARQISWRLSKGWAPERALTTPVRRCTKRST